jgi:hypothetical protein
MTKTERWRPVPGYERLYEISNRGRVRSKERMVEAMGGDSRVLPAQQIKITETGGHRYVMLHRVNANKRVLVQSLAALAWPQ